VGRAGPRQAGRGGAGRGARLGAGRTARHPKPARAPALSCGQRSGAVEQWLWRAFRTKSAHSLGLGELLKGPDAEVQVVHVHTAPPGGRGRRGQGSGASGRAQGARACGGSALDGGRAGRPRGRGRGPAAAGVCRARRRATARGPLRARAPLVGRIVAGVVALRESRRARGGAVSAHWRLLPLGRGPLARSAKLCSASHLVWFPRPVPLRS
jgi:hypothetical protein